MAFVNTATQRERCHLYPHPVKQTRRFGACLCFLPIAWFTSYTEPVNAASRSQNRAGLPYLPAYVLVLSLSNAYASALEIYPLNPNCFLY